MDPVIIQQNPEPNAEARNWATFCHLAAFAGFLIPLIGNMLGPLIIWMLKRDEYAFVREQGKEALNFQITISIAGLLCSLLFFLVIGHLLLGLLLIFNVVSIIIAAVKTSRGVS
ncbi:MAG TPA: DUF4870 domain-containing protein, partial [Pseudomonadales bacterium]|nr:DUF4870 domain-containing protein [Pseudomonadales bacterium]